MQDIAYDEGKSHISILLVDDQKLFAENLKLMLETLTKDMHVIGIAYEGQEAVNMVEEKIPDLILMDVRMPGLDGVKATQIIHQKYPEIKIIMLTTFLDDNYVEDALKHGAYGYILKNIKSEDLISSLRAAHSGTALLSPAILEKLINREAKHEKEEYSYQYREIIRHLGNREKQILALIAKGYNNQKIADTLYISEPTVRNYISSIYAKVGSNDRLEVMSIAQRGYIEAT
ncbi:MAG: response regulator transcription factor [Treponema sp.]|nr:response regulator transcription factor [Treponema sp.]